MIRSLLKRSLFFLANLFHHNHDSKVIYYHDVGKKYTTMGTDLSVIKRHFTIAKECGYDIVKSISSAEGQIMVCFDDGWAGIYDSKDFFIEQNICPTVFVVVDFIGKSGYLSLSQILELQKLGFIFEGHTWSHYDLTTLNDFSLDHEIEDSKVELSRILNKNIESLCFPKGRFSDKVYNRCIKAGYNKLFSSIPGGYYDLLECRNLICRNLVQSAGDKEFKYALSSSSKFFFTRSFRQQYQK